MQSMVMITLFLQALVPLMAQTLTDPAGSNPGVQFSTGFEETNWRTPWDDYDNNPAGSNDLISDPGPAGLAGNHVLRLRSPAGARGGADLVKVLDVPQDRLYARWYQKWESGYNFSAGCHNGGLHAGNRNYLGSSDNRPTGQDWFSAWLEPCGEERFHLYAYYRGMYMDCANPVGSCWGDHLPCMVGSGYCTKPAFNAPPLALPPVPVANRWYCIEIMADAGTPTTDTAALAPGGVLNFWIDGVQYGPFQNLWLRTVADLKLTILYISLFNHDGTHSVGGIMVDDVIISINPIGARGGTSVEEHVAAPDRAALPGPCVYRVYDLTGRLVLQTSGKSGTDSDRPNLRFQGLPNGIYLCRISGNGAPRITKQLILQ